MRKILLFFCFLVALEVSAQPPQVNCEIDGDVPCEELPTPLDDYVLYLVGGGAITGILVQRNIQRKVIASTIADLQQSD